jgi:hypothetical protein
VSNLISTLQRGSALATRDGRKIGNAVVWSASQYMPAAWFVITDAGNVLTFTEGELDTLFYGTAMLFDEAYLTDFVSRRLDVADIKMRVNHFENQLSKLEHERKKRESELCQP